MSVLADLRALLARYDDAAFEALANRGLLRRARKDLEKVQPVLVAEAAEIELAVGDRLVRMDARGPAYARCDCPAAGTCQHILAACLWLKEGVGQGAASPAPSSEASSSSPLEALHAELMSFDPASLEKWSGAAAYRWALELVRDLEGPDRVAIGGERNVVVTFAHPRFACRYLGGGLASAIVDLTVVDPRKYVAAAVLAYQQAQGRALPAPPERRRGARALDLGQDHAVPESRAAQRDELRVRVIDSAERLVLECVLAGLSHLSAAASERFTTLAVSAQGAELHRLALLLRRLADHVDMLLRRDGGADAARMLDDLALAHALLAALRSARVDLGAEGPRHLVGEARSAYESAGPLELLGLGAYPWRTRSGHVGLTLLFRGVADSQWYTWSESRPEIQRAFDPVARYKAPGPWNGAGAPQLLIGKRITLHAAQTNRFGRLSAAEGTSVMVQGPIDAASLREGVISDWAQLEPRLREAGGTLDERDPRRGLCVVRPERVVPAKFDSTRQELVWPLIDASGKTLFARIAFSGAAAHAISRIEDVGGSAGGRSVLVRLVREGGVVLAEPISLLDPAAPDVDAIYFEDGSRKKPTRLQRWVDAARAIGTQAPAHAVIEAPAPGWRFLEPVDAESLRLAERGMMEISTPLLRDLEARLERCGVGGFPLPDLLWRCAAGQGQPRQYAAALLRVRHAVRTLQQA